MKKKTVILIGLILAVLISSVTAVYAVGRSRAYKDSALAPKRTNVILSEAKNLIIIVIWMLKR